MEASSPDTTAYDTWANYYDFGEGDRTPYIGFYSSLLGARTRSILELGCGTGIILSALAQRLPASGDQPRECRIVGIDTSVEMLKVARSRDASIEWIFGDMRSPPVRGPFDLLYCCFNTLQFLLSDRDLAMTFAAVRDLLGPEGIFAFDIYQPNLAYLREPRADTLARTIIDERGRHLEIREDAVYDPDMRVLSLSWRMIERDAPDFAPLARTSYRLRQYFPAEIERLLADAGMVIHQCYGDFDRSAFRENSRKQILVCGRK